MSIHESSPGEPTLSKLMTECPRYLPTQFFPDVPPGSVHNGFRCEDLSRQTFDDDFFDMVITQDVLEHLLQPCAAFREIARTLRPGGVHLFTVPWYYRQETKIRARMGNDAVEYLDEPIYHGNPVDAKGSLVVTEWGRDLCDTIYACSGMTTTVLRIIDRRFGIDAEFIEVFVSRKSEKSAAELMTRWNAV